MAVRYEGEAFAGYRCLGAVSVEFEVFTHAWYATIWADEAVDMKSIQSVRVRGRDFRVELQSFSGVSPSRFKGIGGPPWKA